MEKEGSKHFGIDVIERQRALSTRQPQANLQEVSKKKLVRSSFYNEDKQISSLQ